MLIIIILLKMDNEEQEQGNRYTVISYNDLPDFEETDLFRDQEIIVQTRGGTRNFVSQKKRKNQTIVNIYGSGFCYSKIRQLQIMRGIPYSQNTSNQKIINTQQSPAPEPPTKTSQNVHISDSEQNTTLSKFINEFAKDISHKKSQKNYLHRMQKVTFLKKIIEHYNTKSV